MFKAMFVASDEFCEEDCIDFSWKEELEEYSEENQRKVLYIYKQKIKSIYFGGNYYVS